MRHASLGRRVALGTTGQRRVLDTSGREAVEAFRCHTGKVALWGSLASSAVGPCDKTRRANASVQWHGPCSMRVHRTGKRVKVPTS